jgi:hypothetical protein
VIDADGIRCQPTSTAAFIGPIDLADVRAALGRAGADYKHPLVFSAICLLVFFIGTNGNDKQKLPRLATFLLGALGKIEKLSADFDRNVARSCAVRFMVGWYAGEERQEFAFRAAENKIRDATPAQSNAAPRGDHYSRYWTGQQRFVRDEAPVAYPRDAGDLASDDRLKCALREAAVLAYGSVSEDVLAKHARKVADRIGDERVPDSAEEIQWVHRVDRLTARVLFSLRTPESELYTQADPTDALGALKAACSRR